MKKVIVITASIIVCLVSALAVLVGVIGTDVLDSNSLVFESSNATAEYSGAALTNSDWKIVGGSLKSGHTASVTVTGSQTEVGESKNTMSVSVKNQAGEDVSNQYNIKINEGTLSVSARKIEVKPKDAQKDYDGTSLSGDGYDIVEGELISGHTGVAKYTGEQITVGSSECKMELQVVDEQGNDKTANYDIKYTSGTLTVVKRRVLLVSASKEKTYNGTPLIDRTVNIIEGELVSEHSLSIDASAKITNVGEVSNSFTATVLDVYGNDVTENYELVCNYGKLRVFPVNITVRTDSGTKIYDGTPLSCQKYTIESGLIASGEELTVEFLTSAVNVGFYDNKANFYVKNAAGIDTTKNYTFTVVAGILTIQGRRIVVSSLSDTKLFDGTPLTKHEYELLDGTELVAGHSVSITYRGQQLYVGTSKNEFEVIVRDGDGQDVTANYDIKTVFGNLAVVPTSIAAHSPNVTKTYDGQKLQGSVSDITLLGELALGHRFVIEITGEQTAVGQSGNTFVVRILDENNEDFTYCYDITSVYGDLIVLPREITVESPDLVKTYDGTLLESDDDDIVVSIGTLADGNIIVVDILSSRTNVGTSANRFNIKILNLLGQDVTSNYDITYIYGALTVVKRPIIITSPNINEVYDATEKSSDPDDCLVEGTVADGEEMTIVLPEKHTDVYEGVNTINVMITRGNENVIDNYDIILNEREFIIYPQVISIKSGSAEKEYDGTPLTYDYYEVNYPEQLPGEDRLVVVTTGERLSVGESKNTFTVDILNAEGQSVLFNYIVEKTEGALVVKSISNSDGEGGEGGGGGGSLSGGGGGMDVDTSGSLGGGGGSSADPVVVMQVKSDKTGMIYMRLMSYGDYTGSGWNEADKRYIQLLDNMYSYNYLAGDAMKNSGMTAANLEVKNLSTQYFLPYYLAMKPGDYDLPNNDVMFTNLHDGEYSVKYYLYSGDGSNLSPVSYTTEEQAYREFVYNNYLYVDEETKDFLLGIIAEEGFDVSDSDIVNKVAAYIMASATYDLKYNTDLDQESNVVKAFLETYKTGVCRHYASAATLMFRTLGIPARYTIGYSGATEAGMWTEITSKTAHAWVEIYVDGVGWIVVEATPAQPGGGGGGGGSGGGGGNGGGGSGENGGNMREITLAPVNEYMRYNGTDTLVHSGRLRGLSEYEELGYSYYVVIEGERKDVGVTTAVIKEFILYDPQKNDVTDKFAITFQNGKLQVYEYEITISTGSAEKEYDGVQLSNSTYIVTGDRNVPGHEIKVTVKGKLTNAGIVSNSFDVKIIDYSDPNNPKEVTNRYKINKREGTLQVTHKELIVEADSAEKVYDRTPLTCDTYKAYGQLKDHVVTATVVGSQTKVGSSSNIIESVTVTDEKGKDVTQNYSIIYVSGRLFVSPPN